MSGAPEKPDSDGAAAEASWLAHELAVMAELSETTPLFDGVVFIYELYDQPDIGHSPNLTCATGRTGESCYGLREVKWCYTETMIKTECGGFPFLAGRHKPAWDVVHAWGNMHAQPQLQ
jgi:hypothetical protein